jgi:CRISPR/Cas system CSM-associated protein Csm4 (group 5 of RAMP superfamily)
LFSAFTVAAQQLGFVDEWLDATARNSTPLIQFSSLFPFQGDTLFVTPPASLWPPPAWLVTSPSPVFLTKVRWTAARLAPVPLIESVLLGQKILADQWIADPESGCLLRRDRPSTTPFRTVLRTGAPVDRTTGRSSGAHSFAGVEFEPGAGLWSLIGFRDSAASSQWSERVQGMVRLLGDSGFGGRRTAGWGQTATPELQSGQWPDLLFPKLGRSPQHLTPSSPSSQHWLLSLFSPAPGDQIDWSAGEYSLIERGNANGKRARFVAEGSVLKTENPPIGVAVNVAEPDHQPLYRSGIALSLALPVIEALPAPVEAEAEPVEPPAILPEAVEQPSDLADVIADEPLPEPCVTPSVDVTPEPEPVPEPEPEPEPESEGPREQEQVEEPPAEPASPEEQLPQDEESTDAL